MNKIILICISTLLIFGVTSCTKENKSTSQKGVPPSSRQYKSGGSLLDSVGYYHNEALTLTESYWEGKKPLKLDSSVVHFVKALSIFSPSDFNYTTIMSGYSSIKAGSGPIFLEFSLADTTKTGYDSLMTSNFKYLANTGQISETTADNLISIFLNDGTYTGMDSDLTSLYNSTTGQDKEYVYVGKQILESSHAYWTTLGTNIEAPASVTNRWQVYAWDAAGGIAGLYGGPIWSIVQGAIVSAAFDPGIQCILPGTKI